MSKLLDENALRAVKTYVDNGLSGKLPYVSSYYVKNNGDGTVMFQKVLTITNSGSYINRPLFIEIYGRGTYLSILTIIFQNTVNTDPNISGFWSSDENRYFIARTAANTWCIYMYMAESWGTACIGRIFGEGAEFFTVTNTFELLSELPAGNVQASKRFALASDLNNYLGISATAADSSKLNGQAASYYLDYNNFTNTPTIPTVNNGTLTIQANGITKDTFTANQSGNTTINITASDLGLSSAMHFLGTTTSSISDGSTTNPVTIGGNSVTAAAGDVVLSGHKEFVWTGSAWELLGDEGSYALNSVQVIAGTGLSGGGAISGNVTLNHSNSVTAQTTQALYPITYDAQGHITGAGSAITPIVDSGANPNCGDGTVITQPGGSAAVSIRTTTGNSRDVGIFRLTEDNAYIANSGDNGYVFGVFDTDLTQNFEGAQASFVVLQSGGGVNMKGTASVAGGLVQIANNGNTLSLGSQNSSWCHIESSADVPFYLNHSTHVNGDFNIYNTNWHLSQSGELSANTVKIATKATMQYNSSEDCIEFVFA